MLFSLSPSLCNIPFIGSLTFVSFPGKRHITEILVNLSAQSYLVMCIRTCTLLAPYLLQLFPTSQVVDGNPDIVTLSVLIL